MKRLWIGLLLVSVFAVAGYSKKNMTAVGLYGNLMGSGTGAAGGSIGLSLKFGRFPVLGIEYSFRDNGGLGVSCDWWVVNDGLGGTLLHYYLGIGAFAGLRFNTSQNAIDVGGRIPIGLQIFPVKNFELFGELAPLVYFLPEINIGYNARLGLRVHF